MKILWLEFICKSLLVYNKTKKKKKLFNKKEQQKKHATHNNKVNIFLHETKI